MTKVHQQDLYGPARAVDPASTGMGGIVQLGLIIAAHDVLRATPTGVDE